MQHQYRHTANVYDKMPWIDFTMSGRPCHIHHDITKSNMIFKFRYWKYQLKFVHMDSQNTPYGYVKIWHIVWREILCEFETTKIFPYNNTYVRADYPQKRNIKIQMANHAKSAINRIFRRLPEILFIPATIGNKRHWNHYFAQTVYYDTIPLRSTMIDRHAFRFITEA